MEATGLGTYCLTWRFPLRLATRAVAAPPHGKALRRDRIVFTESRGISTLRSLLHWANSRGQLVDLAPKRSARDFALGGEAIQPCRHLVKAASPCQPLQLGTVLRQGERSQRCARALEPVGGGQQRRLVPSRGCVPELREHARRALEKRRHDLAKRVRVA